MLSENIEDNTGDFSGVEEKKRKNKLTFSYLRRVVEDAYQAEGKICPQGFRVENFYWRKEDSIDGGERVFVVILTNVRMPIYGKVIGRIGYRLIRNCIDFDDFVLSEKNPIKLYITSSMGDFQRNKSGVQKEEEVIV